MSSDTYYGELSTLEFIANSLDKMGNTDKNIKQLHLVSESFFEKSGILKYYFGFKYIGNSKYQYNGNNNNKIWEVGEIVEIASKGDISNTDNLYSSNKIIGNYMFILYTY